VLRLLGLGKAVSRRTGKFSKRCEEWTEVGRPSIAVDVLPESVNVYGDAPKSRVPRQGLKIQGLSPQLSDSRVAQRRLSGRRTRPFVEATFELVEQPHFV